MMKWHAQGRSVPKQRDIGLLYQLSSVVTSEYISTKKKDNARAEWQIKM